MTSTGNRKMLNQIQKCLSNYPVERAWLFGSYSRGEEKDESDIDILVKYDSNVAISLFTISKIMVQLSKVLGRKVDLVEEDALLPFASASVNKDKILIYERGN